MTKSVTITIFGRAEDAPLVFPSVPIDDWAQPAKSSAAAQSGINRMGTKLGPEINSDALLPQTGHIERISKAGTELNLIARPAQ
jgi:hypothetical protein